MSPLEAQDILTTQRLRFGDPLQIRAMHLLSAIEELIIRNGGAGIFRCPSCRGCGYGQNAKCEECYGSGELEIDERTIQQLQQLQGTGSPLLEWLPERYMAGAGS